jgi:hypothetical protein
LCLIATLAANNFEFFAVVNCNIVAQVMAKCNIMAALESEFLAFENPHQDVFQEFGLAVLSPLFVCHIHLPENRSPAGNPAGLHRFDSD